MPSTWILVADESGARVYESRGDGGTRLVRDLPPRDARAIVHVLRASEREDEVRPSPPVPPLEASRFARELAWLLGRARAERFFQKLVLIAPAQMLGSIRRELDPPTRALLEDELPLDVDLSLPPAHHPS